MPFILLVLGMQYTATADMLLFCWYKACSTATADMPFILLVLGMQYTATADMLLFCWY